MNLHPTQTPMTTPAGVAEKPVVHWPRKPAPSADAGALGLEGDVTLPDCDRCMCYNVSCDGYKPLSINTTPRPCKTHETYTDYVDARRCL